MPVPAPNLHFQHTLPNTRAWSRLCAPAGGPRALLVHPAAGEWSVRGLRAAASGQGFRILAVEAGERMGEAAWSAAVARQLGGDDLHSAFSADPSLLLVHSSEESLGDLDPATLDGLADFIQGELCHALNGRNIPFRLLLPVGRSRINPRSEDILFALTTALNRAEDRGLSHIPPL
jgi:hypothetical protein